tara:strand:+ start:12137 stop:12712 length:576 start_codon:yes stop_codon:yes gene_type:complete
MDQTKLKLVKKGWHVYHEGMIGYGPEIYNSIEDTPVVYAETAGKAKSGATAPYEWDLEAGGGEPEYKDLKVKRAKDSDLYEFEDGLEKKEFAKIRAQRIRLKEMRDKINSLPADATFYVQNGFVGNAMLFWGLGSSGYTAKLEKAQEYTKEYILEHFVPGRENDIIWYSKHIKECTTLMVDGQHVNYDFKI